VPVASPMDEPSRDIEMKSNWKWTHQIFRDPRSWWVLVEIRNKDDSPGKEADRAGYFRAMLLDMEPPLSGVLKE
jgi:hypothetical protein